MKAMPLLMSIFISLFFGCSPSTKLPFDFNNPDESVKLPNSLHEISGIAFYRKNELACVQDEKGNIYFYDIQKDKLRAKLPFGKDKDYEGIAIVDDVLFVLCSNGVIYEVDGDSESKHANKYDTFLASRNDAEGLCYDQENNRLLVACKGKPGEGIAKGMKAVYSFDLSKKELSEKPAFIIDPDSIQKYLVRSSGAKSNDESPIRFEPSEICIDPFTANIYILASAGKIILVMSRTGQMLFAVRLDPEIYKQPEGLAFSQNGDLYISDEGRNGKANIIKLKRNSK